MRMSSQTPDYEIHFTNSAAREFRSLPSDIKRRVVDRLLIPCNRLLVLLRYVNCAGIPSCIGFAVAPTALFTKLTTQLDVSWLRKSATEVMCTAD